jgi:actin-related protein
MTNSPPHTKPLLVQVVSKKSSRYTNYLHFSFLAVAVVGFLILGLVSTSDHGISPSMMPSVVQATNSSEITNISSNFSTVYEKSYDNCLVYGSGESVTVTCPTNDGSVILQYHVKKYVTDYFGN